MTGSPARRRTGADLSAALGGIEPPDDRFAEDIAAALATLDPEVPDPWAAPEPRRTAANQYEDGGIPR